MLKGAVCDSVGITYSNLEVEVSKIYQMNNQAKTKES